LRSEYSCDPDFEPLDWRNIAIAQVTGTRQDDECNRLITTATVWSSNSRMSDWKKRGLRTVVVGIAGSLFIIAWARHDSCFYFNNSVLNDANRILLVFNLVWWALTFMFVFPAKGKRCLYISIGLVTGIVLSYVLLPPIDPPNAAWSLEEGAIHVFKDNAQVLDHYHVEHHAYPASFEVRTSSALLRRYFDFQYVPVREEDGTIGTYRIEGRPAHPPCGCDKSLTFTPDGNIYATTQFRAATNADERIRKVSW
jgi:hypothetical protein